MDGLIQLQLEDFLITVDHETAEALQSNAEMRQAYIKEIKKHMEGPGSTSNIHTTSEQSEQKLLWSSKHPTSRDIEATAVFLELRKELNLQFADKKNSKTILWAKVANEMKKRGYEVGDGERCRKKFVNLQAGYFKYKDERKQTGMGKIEKPSFFDELDIILGDKHKTEPPAVMDSINIKTPEGNIEHVERKKIVENENSEQNEPGCSSKFMNIKSTIKPNKNAILEKFCDLQKQNIENRKNEFCTLMEFLEKQAERRHQEIMLLLQNQDKKGKKRPLDDD